MTASQARSIIDNVLASWNEARGERKMPTRKDIDPRRLGRFLPYITLLDVVRGETGEPDFRFRLIGEHVNEHSDRPLLGTLQSQHLSPDPEQRPVRAAYVRCLEIKEPIVGEARFLRPDYIPMTVYGVVCPLSSDGLTVDGILTAAVFLETPLEAYTDLKQPAFD